MVRARTTSASPAGSPNNEVRWALKQCDEICELIEDLPETAFDFGESVGEKVRGIAQTIERTNEVTKPQQSALDNMQAGVERWLERD